MARQHIAFKIEGITVDLFDASKLPIALTFSTDVLGQIGKRSGGFSKSFEVPATAANNKLFGQFYNPSIIGNGAELLKREAAFEVNGIELVRGKAIVTNVTRQGSAIKYKVQLFEGNLSWVTDIDNLELSDLDFSASDHQLNDANISASSVNFPGVSNYIYGLVNYGEWSEPNRVTTLDFRPAVSAKETLEKIFKNVGYEIVSDFISGLSGFAFDRLNYLSGAPFVLGEDDLARYSFEGETSADAFTAPLPFVGAMKQQATAANFDIEISDPSNINAFNDATGPIGIRSYVHPPGGALGNISKVYVRLKIEIEVITWGPLPTGSIVIADRTLGTSYDFQPLWDIAGPGLYTFDYEVGPFTIDTTNPAALDITVYVHTFMQTLAQHFKIKAGSKMWIRPANQIQIGQAFNFAKSAIKPGLMQLDFIRGITHAFNLYYTTDILGRTVTIEPRGDFFSNSEIVELDAKLDQGKGSVVSYWDKIKRRLKMAFKSDSADGFTGELEGRESDILYSSEYTFSNRTKEGEDKNENPFFAPTHNIRDARIVATSLTTAPNPPAIPRIWSDIWPENTGDYPDKVTDFEPRLLYYAGLVGGGGGGWKFEQDSGVIIDSNTWPQNCQVNYNDFSGSIPSLSYGDQTINGVLNRGLTFTYYLRQLASLRDGAILTAFLNYDLTDLTGDDLKKIILLSYSQWQIIEIADFKPVVPGPTKTTFLQILEPLATDEDKLKHSTISGINELEV